MKIAVVDRTLRRLAELIGQGRFEELETDTLEIKPVPAEASLWRERLKSVCAFLNTRGGVLILGIKEEGAGSARKYVFSGWQPHAEPKLKDMSREFTEHDGTPLDLGDAFPPPTIRDFLGGKVGVLLVDELSADRKFVFYRGVAYRRFLTCVLPTSLELGLRSQTIVCEIQPQEHARSIETPREAISGHSDHDCVLSRLTLVTSVESSPTPSFREKGGVPAAACALKWSSAR